VKGNGEVPVSIEAERAVLGSVLIDGHLVGISGVRSGDFYVQKHQRIWAAMEKLHSDGMAIDYLTLGNELKTRGQLEDVGGAPYVSGLTDDCPTAVNLTHYARVVKEKAHRRQILGVCMETQTKITSGDLSEIIRDLAASLKFDGVHGKYREMSPTDLMEVVEKNQYPEGGSQVETGFLNLKPYRPGRDELIIIAGRPGTGKSSLMMALAENMSMLGRPVLILSGEMSTEVCQLRRLSAITGLTFHELTNPGLNTEQWSRVANGLQTIKERPVRVLSGVFTLDSIRAQIAIDRQKRGTQAVFFDHLGKIRKPGRQRHDIEIGDITEGLASEAKHHQIPIFLLHQLSRKSEEREDRRPQLTDLRDSGRIEEDADCAWLIYRANKHDHKADDTFEIHAAKTRNGPEGVALLHYDNRYGRFWDKEGVNVGNQ
jgi:replicative DNA helicase